MPDLLPGPSGLPPVRWCISVLEWVGWTLDDTTKINGYRSYLMTDCDGKTNYLTTYGLRRAALRMWFQYGVKPEENFVNPLSGL